MKNNNLKVLIIGSGGREHALAWKIAQSHRVAKVWVAPGNAGTELEHKVQNINLPVDNPDKLVQFAKENLLDFVVIGPEAALAAGVSDAFQSAEIPCFGPTREVAQLETSKVFSKDFMQRHQIPTATYATFDSKTAALAYASRQKLPLVIKADGLAAGKGVIIAQTSQEVEQAIAEMLEEKRFGAAGTRIVIEEFLQGSEMSYIVMVDGQNFLPLASSKDHKRRDDGDLGPNTGGMGAISPAPQVTTELEEQIAEKIIKPVIAAFAAAGTPYVGFLYAGLMISPEGQANVLEFNCRLGDPETQPILMRLESDLVDILFAAFEKRLNSFIASWDSRPGLSVVLAAGGYPDAYQKDETIQVFVPKAEFTKIFHAGTLKQGTQIVTNGGRVLAVTTLGENLKDAQKRAYDIVKQVAWANCHYRKDIGG